MSTYEHATHINHRPIKSSHCAMVSRNASSRLHENSSHLITVMAPKKRLFTERVQPSQTMCQEHQIVGGYHHKPTVQVHVFVNDGCKEDYKSRRAVSLAHYSDAHSEPVDVTGMLCKNDTITGHSESKFRKILVSHLLDAENTYDSKRQCRFSFLSDISNASGLSGIENDETDVEEATACDYRQGDYYEACQLKSSIVSAFSDGGALLNHECDERANSLRPASNPQQASLSFFPTELTAAQNDPATATSSFLPAYSSERSLCSADFTVTGLYLDDASYVDHSVNENKVKEYKDENGRRKRRICRDRACNNLFLSANYAVPVSVQEPDDDSIVSVIGSHVSPVFATSYQIRTKGPNNESWKQNSRSSSHAVLEVVAAIFKKTKLAAVAGHRSEGDLIVGFDERRNKSKDGCVAKGRNSKVFAYDFSAWEKR